VNTMKAIVRDAYGRADVLKFEDVARPVPTADEVLVRVRASSLNRADRYVLQGKPMLMRLMTGLFGPKKRGQGMDFAGDVEGVGASVTDVRPGEAVYGQVDLGETWAEYSCVPAALVAPKPANLDYEQAGAVPVSAFTSLQGLRDQGGVGPDTTVLINGATGAVGTFAVQIARALGAGEVWAVCGERNAAMVRSLGADHVIPYEREDYLACGRTFDVMFDVIGNRSLRENCAILQPDGIFVPVGAPEGGSLLGPVPHLIATSMLAPFVKPAVKSFVGTPNRPDLLTLTEMIEAGKVTPAIDRSFQLADTADAMRYLMEGRPPGKVVITV
jgi:NADPH:quinone reductase-like Zn-dependent oxidoreductase